ncbi:hypothetical protein AB2C98_32835, partial [Pseudomonas aeruginosa]
QFAPNFPAVMIADTTLVTTKGIVSNLMVGYGVSQTGNTAAVGIRRGQMFAWRLENVHFFRFASGGNFPPYDGTDQVTGTGTGTGSAFSNT